MIKAVRIHRPCFILYLLQKSGAICFKPVSVRIRPSSQLTVVKKMWSSVERTIILLLIKEVYDLSILSKKFGAFKEKYFLVTALFLLTFFSNVDTQLIPNVDLLMEANGFLMPLWSLRALNAVPGQRQWLEAVVPVGRYTGEIKVS